MKIRVKISAHSYSADYEGTVLLWTQTVENIGGKYFQVPAVILDTETGIETISLKDGKIEKI